MNISGVKRSKKQNMASVSSLRLAEESQIFRTLPKDHPNIYEDLKDAFKKAANIVVSDPLMQCFKENPESEVFMFDRIEEIICENVQKVIEHDGSKICSKYEELLKVSEGMKVDLEILANENISLKEEIHSKNNYETVIESDIEIALKKRIESLENQIEQRNGDFDRMMDKLRSKDEQIEQLLDLVEKQKKSLDDSRSGDSERSENFDSIRSLINEQKSSLGIYEKELEEKDEAIEQKQECIRNLKQALMSTESELRKLNLKRDDIEKNQMRKISDLRDEIGMYKKTIKDLNTLMDKYNSFEDKSNITISKLELKIKKMSDNLEQKNLQIEQTKFAENETVKLKDKLKEKIKELTNSLNNLQKEKSEVEINSQSLSKTVSELRINQSMIIDDLKKTQKNLELSENMLKTTQSELKIERRKTCSLEREVDQMKFSVKTGELELAQITGSLKNQIEKLRVEKNNLSTRMQFSLEDTQKKLEIEREMHIKSKNRVELLEESEEKLKVLNENLKKKVDFFKSQTLNNQHSQALNLNKNKQGDVKKLMSELLEKSRENSKLRSSISWVRNKMKELILEFRKEKNDLRRKMESLRGDFAGIFNLAFSKFKNELKKSESNGKDVSQMKRDLDYFERYSNCSFQKTNQNSRRVDDSFGNFDSDIKRTFPTKMNFSRFEFQHGENATTVEKARRMVDIPKISLVNLNRPESSREDDTVHNDTMPISDFDEKEGNEAANFYLSNSETGSIFNPKDENFEVPIIFAKKNDSLNRVNVSQISRNPSKRGELGSDINKIEQESQEIEKRISMLKRKGSSNGYNRSRKFQKSEGYQKALESAREMMRKKAALGETREMKGKMAIGMVSSNDKENEHKRVNDSFSGDFN